MDVCIADVYLQSVTSFCTILTVSLDDQRLTLMQSSLLVFPSLEWFLWPLYLCLSPYQEDTPSSRSFSVLLLTHRSLIPPELCVWHHVEVKARFFPCAYHVMCIVYWKKNSFSTQGPLLLIRWSYMCSCITWLTVLFLGLFVYPCSDTTLSDPLTRVIKSEINSSISLVPGNSSSFSLLQGYFVP